MSYSFLLYHSFTFSSYLRTKSLLFMPILPIFRYLFLLPSTALKLFVFVAFCYSFLFSSAKDRGILPHHCLHIIAQSGWIQIEMKKKKKKRSLCFMLCTSLNSKVIYNKKQSRIYEDMWKNVSGLNFLLFSPHLIHTTKIYSFTLYVL